MSLLTIFQYLQNLPAFPSLLVAVSIATALIFLHPGFAPRRTNVIGQSSPRRPNEDQDEAFVLFGEDSTRNDQPNTNNASRADAPPIHTSEHKNLTSTQYTIGLITALSDELRAVIAVLDEEHGYPSDLKSHELDTNDYIWGRIAEHNIVVVSCPMKMPGKVNAATTALLMVRQIPSIRFCLMVGIGGGVPHPEETPDKQVRLGDVVISVPDGTTGGVVQYDLGKEEVKDGQTYFRRTGSLDHPPRALLTVLQTFKARLKLPSLHETIETAVSNIGTKIKTFNNGPVSAYPGWTNDHLFPAAYKHQTTRPWYSPFGSGLLRWTRDSPHELQSQDCPFCSQNKATKRRDRAGPCTPKIHYGLIASGDKVIKHAQTRDNIVSQLKQENVGNCLCFEMEAAGLMNNFPCLIIRGISDYADSHKNDTWHNYATLTAAAVAKELLRFVRAAEVKSERTALDVVEETRQTVKEIKSDLTTQGIRNWLKPADPSVNYNTAVEMHNRYLVPQAQANDWFLKHEAFEHWLMGGIDHLWIVGTSGSGKTVLSSTIIGRLSEKCLYFYFDFRDTNKQTLNQVLRSLVFQLYCQKDSSRWVLEKLWSDHHGGNQQPQTSRLIETFDRMARQKDDVRIVLDALDESIPEPNIRQELLLWLKDRIRSQGSDHCKIRIIMTSRSNQLDLNETFDPCIHRLSKVCIENESARRDIRTYIQNRFQRDPGFQDWQKDTGFLKEMEEKLMEKSGVMFRWASLQLDELGKLNSKEVMEHALQDLPSGLDETYARSLKGVPDRHRGDAIRLLQLLIFSRRPISLEGALRALTVDVDGPPGSCIRSERLMPNMRSLSTLMSSLIKEVRILCRDYSSEESMDRMVTGLQIAHSSVRDYFRSSQLEPTLRPLFTEFRANETLLGVCLAYFESVMGTEPRFGDSFYGYAHKEWLTHAKVTGVEEAAHKNIMRFLILNGLKTLPETGTSRDSDYRGPPLYVASATGLVWTVERLLERGINPNEGAGTDWFFETSGSLYYRNFLSGYNIDELRAMEVVDGRDYHFGSPLIAACCKGHEQIVRMLLDRGAEVNAQFDNNRENALYAVCYTKHEGSVWLLLKRGADVNAKRDKRRHSLIADCRKGNETIVRMLQEAGADANILWDASDESPLSVASSLGNEKIVGMLIGAGADVNAKSGKYGYALHCASRWTNTGIVQMLIDAGADVNAQGGHFWTALQSAAAGYSVSVVKMLLEHGADPNVQGGEYGCALGAACHGYNLLPALRVARLLLESGADPNLVTGKYRGHVQKVLDKMKESATEGKADRDAA